MTWRYEVHGYRRVPGACVPGSKLVLRPGWRTALLRLRVTVFMVVIGLFAWYLVSLFINSALERNRPFTVTPEQQRELDEVESHFSPADRAKIQEDRNRKIQESAAHFAIVQQKVAITQGIRLALMVLLALIGLAAPVSAIWNRLIVMAPEPGVLELLETGWWPRRRTIRMGEYLPPRIEEMERRSGGDGRSPISKSWAWEMVLRPLPGTGAREVRFLLQISSSWAASAELPADALAEFVEPFYELLGMRWEKKKYPKLVP